MNFDPSCSVIVPPYEEADENDVTLIPNIQRLFDVATGIRNSRIAAEEYAHIKKDVLNIFNHVNLKKFLDTSTIRLNDEMKLRIKETLESKQ